MSAVWLAARDQAEEEAGIGEILRELFGVSGLSVPAAGLRGDLESGLDSRAAGHAGEGGRLVVSC